MEYAFFDQGDERLLELADLPLEGGIAVAMRTTGYALDADEIVELAIVDLDGNELFSKRVKPQNIEEWTSSEASGGISPDDVAEEPELYQFEDDIIEIIDNASIVVCAHLPFTRSLIEGSWISLPEHEGFDLAEEFRLSHCTRDYPREPASAAALDDIIVYYGIDRAADNADGTLVAEAATIAACYRALVREHADVRDGKGASYWEARERRLAEEAAQDNQKTEVQRIREKRLNQMNGLLWVSGAIIFISLIIQLYQRGGDPGFMIISGAVAVFCLIRAVANFRK